MGPIGPMMTKTWIRVAKEVLRDQPPRKRYLGNLTVGSSVDMNTIAPSLSEIFGVK